MVGNIPKNKNHILNFVLLLNHSGPGVARYRRYHRFRKMRDSRDDVMIRENDGGGLLFSLREQQVG